VQAPNSTRLTWSIVDGIDSSAIGFGPVVSRNRTSAADIAPPLTSAPERNNRRGHSALRLGLGFRVTRGVQG